MPDEPEDVEGVLVVDEDELPMPLLDVADEPVSLPEEREAVELHAASENAQAKRTIHLDIIFLLVIEMLRMPSLRHIEVDTVE